MSKEITSVRVEKEYMGYLRKKSKETGVPLTWHINKAIGEYVEAMKKKEN